MWNAYAGSTTSLPKRDVRFDNLTVDGSLNFSAFDVFDAVVTQEDGATTTVEITVLKMGDIISLYIPQLSATANPFTQAYKSIPIPAIYRPVADGQTQPIVVSYNNTINTGNCEFESVSELRLYTVAARTLPTAGVASIVYPQIISYFKSL